MEPWEIHPSLVHVYHGAMGVEPSLLSPQPSQHQESKADESQQTSVAHVRAH